MKKIYNLLAVLIVIGAITFFVVSCKKGSTPDPQPTATTLAITDFTPKAGLSGTVVTITGTGFGTDLSRATVSFGTGSYVTPQTITATSMTVVVPVNSTTGKINLNINQSGSTTSASDFVFTPSPTITSFAALSGKIGDVIVIKGTNFGTDTSAVVVKFGTSAGIKPSLVTATSMSVKVPSDAATGKIQLTVNGSAPVISTDNFTFVPSVTITDFTPKSVSTGDTIKITGTLFGSSIDNVRVYLNRTGSDAGTKPIKVTPTEISVIVPTNAIAGKVQVTVTGFTGFVESKDVFTILPRLQVFSPTPTSGRVTEAITINGSFTGLDYTKMLVYFTGSTTGVKPTGGDNSSNIYVSVPIDAQSGKIKISMPGYGIGTSLGSFTVLGLMPSPQSGLWVQRPDYWEGRVGAVAFTIGSSAYIGTGTDPSIGASGNLLSKFNPQYDAWTSIASLSAGKRAYSASFVIGSKAYIGTGIDGTGTTQKDFWEYDPATNAWTQKADFKGGARSRAVGFSIGSTGYIGSGSSNDNNASSNDFYAYNPTTNAWTAITAIPAGRKDAFSFVIGNYAYVGGGYQSNSPMSDFYMFDPSTNTWTAKAFPTAYAFPGGSASFTISGKGYIGLGYNYFTGTNVKQGTKQVYEYTPSTNSWKAMPDFGGTARFSATGFAIGDVGYFGLGQQSGGFSTYRDIWSYKN